MKALRIPFLLPLVVACDLQVADQVSELPADSGAPDSTDSAVPADTGEGDSDPGPFDRDDDGDGYSENEGDCDDEDPATHPGAEDLCDSHDNDCDDELEEDAASDDIYEPNDGASEWFYLGSLVDSASFSVSGILHNDDDKDRFSVYADDPWYSSFGFQVSLSNIPSQAIYQLQVGLVGDDGELVDSQSVYGEDSLSIAVEGTAGVEDEGTYGAIVSAVGGADCGRSYLLTISDS